MEDIGEVRPEDVLEVEVGAVEGAYGGEGVLLVEGVEGDQAPVADGVDVVVGGAEDAPDINVGLAGEAAADLVAVEEEADTAADPLGPSTSRGRKSSANDEMAQRLETAIEAYKADLFRSVRACAIAHRVSPCTLGKMLKDPEQQYKGRGNVSKVFSKLEEDRIAAHITERMLLGCGLDVLQVRMTQ